MDVRNAGYQKRELGEIRNMSDLVWVPPRVDTELRTDLK